MEPTISAEHVPAHDGESEDSESDGDDAIDVRADLSNLSSLSTTLELQELSEIRVAWCNINGCDDSGTLERVITLMRIHRLDLLCLTDTRVTTPAYADFLRSSALQQLGSGASIEFFLTKPSRDTDHQNIGGQIILKSPRILGPHRRFQDPSGLGVVAGLDFHIGDTDIRVMSTYWPGSKRTNPTSMAPGSLWSKLELFLDSQKHFIDPLSYIQEFISAKLDEHLQLPQSATLVGGDFNALRSVRSPGRGVHAPIEDWVRQTGQLHVFGFLDLPTIPTYYSGLRPKYEIDHILVSNNPHLVPIRGTVLDDTAWAQETDHRPVVADFSIPGFSRPHRSRWKRRKRREKVVDIDRSNRREVSLYQKGMSRRWRPLSSLQELSVQQLHDRLLRIHSDTFKVAEHICSHSRRKRGNWSPQTYAIRCRLGAILSMSRVLGRRGVNQDGGDMVRKICRRWRTHIRSVATSREEATSLESLQGKGPSFWENRPVGEIRELLPRELRFVRNKLCGRKVAERRQFFKNLRTRREKKRLQGKHLSDIRSMLGDTKTGPMLDTLDEEGGTITSAREIVDHSTTFFREWHAKKDVDFGFHSPTADSERLLADWDHFRSSHLSTGIPDDILRALWDSLRAPKQHLQHSLHYSRFLATIDEPPTLAEFRRALRQSKRQASAGMSGVTYN